eukprot:gene11428-biopygen11105
MYISPISGFGENGKAPAIASGLSGTQGPLAGGQRLPSAARTNNNNPLIHLIWVDGLAATSSGGARLRQLSELDPLKAIEWFTGLDGLAAASSRVCGGVVQHADEAGVARALLVGEGGERVVPQQQRQLGELHQRDVVQRRAHRAGEEVPHPYRHRGGDAEYRPRDEEHLVLVWVLGVLPDDLTTTAAHNEDGTRRPAAIVPAA